MTTRHTLGRTLVLIQGGMSIGGVTSAVNQERSSVHSFVQAGDVVIVWATLKATTQMEMPPKKSKQREGCLKFEC